MREQEILGRVPPVGQLRSAPYPPPGHSISKVGLAFGETQDFTATMAHVHEGASGSNGGVALDLNTSGSDWIVASGAQLSAAQYLAFQMGELYFNAHSASFPAGEVRGQITVR